MSLKREILAVQESNMLLWPLLQVDERCVSVSYASISWSADMSLARDQMRDHLLVISLRVETDIGVSFEHMGHS